MDRFFNLRAICVMLLFSICIVDILGNKFDGKVQEMEFYWRREKWKACIKTSTCDEPGIRRRALTCVNSKGEKVPSKNCDRSNRPRRKEFCVIEECIHQTKFRFDFTPWQGCKAEQFLDLEVKSIFHENSTVESWTGATGKSMQLGITGETVVLNSCGSFENALVYVNRRNVTCIAHWSDGKTEVETSLEHCLDREKARPALIKLCSIGCKERCSVGMWTSWESTQFLRKDLRFRRRQITYFPYAKNTTDICMPLVDFRTVKGQSLKEYPSVQYDFYEWGECKRRGPAPGSHLSEPEDKATTIGIQTRALKCAVGKGARINCDQGSSNNITKSQLCILPRDCKVTEWSGWSRCEAVYLMDDRTTQYRSRVLKVVYLQRRMRTVKSAQRSFGKNCPHLLEKRGCEAIKPPLFEQGNFTDKNSSYFWFLGSYSKCRSNPKDCRSGTKHRSVFCVKRGDENLNPVGSQFCAHMDKPGEVAFCRSQCKDVCVLGGWGSWSGCTAECTGKTAGIIKGTHYRVRRVLQYSGDQNACPNYAESRPCTLRSCISWVAGTQTICLMDNIHRACGNGKTHRAVYCMNAIGQQVSEALCKEKMPPRSLPCHVPCSDDCVVGTWSSWGICEGQCSVNGTQTASYRTRKRRILANPGWSGRPCPDQSELIQRESCIGESCGTYHWGIGTWGSCQMRHSDRSKGGNTCAFGVAYRRISCVNEAGINVNDNLCSSFLRPRGRKECRLCPEDCVVSPWSEWSGCPTEFSYGKSQFYRRRQRFIIRFSRDGGKACPKQLIQIEKCNSCKDYEWRFTGWSNCTALRNEECNGLKTRRVTCVRKSDSTSQPDGYCLAKNKKPLEYVVCTRRTCKESCVLSQWSNWGKCSKNCGTGFSRRTRDILGNRADCKPNTKMTEETSCNTQACGQYSLRIGKWSRCYASDSKSQCGVGHQWRNVTCFKISGQEAALDYCIEELYGGQLTLQFERRCTVKCPLDCKLSSWTEFTPCSRKCGSGIKTRFRAVVQKATHGGQVCAAEMEQVTQTIPCIERQCYNFVWGADPWSVCKVTNQTAGRITKCGTGIQTRTVYCTDTRYSGRQHIVNDSFCDAKERPSTRESCTLYCPRDCVVGEWTIWSRCSSVCPKPGHKRRERTVLRYPAHNGKRCPKLEEYKGCNLKHCFTHYWRPTKWSSCLFYEDDVSCGIGRQRRLADCIRNDGKIVHPFYCRVAGRRVPMLLRMCTVPCPRNCEISEWGMWSSCQDKCNTISVQRRNRFVLAHAQNGGQPCLENELLQEFRSCPMKPCYKVKVGKWETCRPYVEQACGFGIRRRLVHCVRDDGKNVDEWHCPEMKSDKYAVETSCRIPCQGDCIVSEWSMWSSCFATCTVKNQSMFEYGIRIRTRHTLQQAETFGKKCPPDLMERERCYDEKCFTFSWKTSHYVKKTRDVWCERSDGLRVSNGCEKGEKPSETETCRPECSVSHSYCNRKIVCACKKHFIPIFSSHGHLIHCLSNSNPFRNDSNEVVISTSSKSKKDASWFADLPIIIWVVIGVCFVYLLLFLAIVIVYTRRRRGITRQRRAETVDVGTLTNPERIPLKERPRGHERTESKASFATSSGRGSTLSTIGDHDDGEQWPEPPDDIVSEFIRQHLKNFNNSSICSTFNDESLDSQERIFTSKGASFDASGTL